MGSQPDFATSYLKVVLETIGIQTVHQFTADETHLTERTLQGKTGVALEHWLGSAEITKSICSSNP
ncbi:hypothetical protein SAMN05428979_3942 [Stappia sp. ES.058]|nr:hypothetical protein SAMN05428979_3942 [Stappia sp. ES.058]